MSQYPADPQIHQPYETALRAVLDNPQTIERLFAHVANGGDLITFCALLSVRYSDVANWISADDARQKRYSAAAVLGMEWLKQRLINELQTVGIADVRLLLDERGAVRPPAEWPEAVARTVSDIEIEELYTGEGEMRRAVGRKVRIRRADKLKGIEMLGKQLGMFAQVHKLEVATKLEDLVGGSFEELPAPVKPNGQPAS